MNLCNLSFRNRLHENDVSASLRYDDKKAGGGEMRYGYIRVSSKEQNIDRQVEAFAEYEIDQQNLYIDMQSGKDFSRPAYQKLLQQLEQGDLLIVKSIDRLGRNYSEILEQWRIITKEIRADILIIDMPLLDTRAKGKDLTGTFIADLVLQILAYVAETERAFIRQRQAEGIACAKAKGIRFGRAPVQRPEEFEDLKALWEKKEISAREAGRRLSVTHRTFLKWVREGEVNG